MSAFAVQRVIEAMSHQTCHVTQSKMAALRLKMPQSKLGESGSSALEAFISECEVEQETYRVVAASSAVAKSDLMCLLTNKRTEISKV